MINLETATREELLAYIESQKVSKKVNKTTKLTEELLELFNQYSDNSDDKLFYIYYLLSTIFSLNIPINEELDKLGYTPQEDDLKKVAIAEIKKAAKELQLRKSKKHNVAVAEEVEEREVSTPL